MNTSRKINNYINIETLVLIPITLILLFFLNKFIAGTSFEHGLEISDYIWVGLASFLYLINKAINEYSSSEQPSFFDAFQCFKQLKKYKRRTRLPNMFFIHDFLLIGIFCCFVFSITIPYFTAVVLVKSTPAMTYNSALLDILLCCSILFLTISIVAKPNLQSRKAYYHIATIMCFFGASVWNINTNLPVLKFQNDDKIREFKVGMPISINQKMDEMLIPTMFGSSVIATMLLSKLQPIDFIKHHELKIIIATILYKNLLINLEKDTHQGDLKKTISLYTKRDKVALNFFLLGERDKFLNVTMQIINDSLMGEGVSSYSTRLLQLLVESGDIVSLDIHKRKFKTMNSDTLNSRNESINKFINDYVFLNNAILKK